MNQIADELIESGEKKLINFFVVLDLAKAFNTVNHKTLISKFKNYNIKSSKLNLLKNYLNDRSQPTVINNIVSEREIVNVRMQQGSCLGYLLFLVILMIFFF